MVEKIDKFAAAENFAYRSDYKKIVMNSLSTFKKLNSVASEDMNSAVSAAMESAMQQTSSVLEVSDQEVIELMKALSVRTKDTNSVLSQNMDVDKIIREKLGDKVISKEMIESLLDTIASKFQKFQVAKNQMVMTNNANYAIREQEAKKNIEKQVGKIKGYKEDVKDGYQLSWGKKFSDVDESVSSSILIHVKDYKKQFILGFHVVTTIGVIAVTRAFANRRNRKGKKQ